MFRSTLATTSSLVYSVAWSPDSQLVLYSSGLSLTIKPLVWRGGEGLILCTDWSASTGRIVTGREECRYRVWDMFGRQLYSSGLHDYPITSLAFSPDGENFAVGSFNTLRLCDKIGWSHSLDKPATGSIYKKHCRGWALVKACGTAVRSNIMLNTNISISIEEITDVILCVIVLLCYVCIVSGVMMWLCLINCPVL